VVGSPGIFGLTRIGVRRNNPRPSRCQGSNHFCRRAWRVDQQNDRRLSRGVPICVRHTSWHPHRRARSQRNGLLALGQGQRAGEDIASLGVLWMGMWRRTRIVGWQCDGGQCKDARRIHVAQQRGVVWHSGW